MNGAPVAPEVREAAIDWIVRFQSGMMSPADHQALHQWRHASAENEYAWRRVASLPLILQPGANLLSDVNARRVLEEAGADPARRRQVLKCMLGLGLLGGLFWQGAESTLVHAAFATYRTATGERRRWTLADGSSLWLNTSSAVSLDFSTNLRGMQLIEGEVALDARAELRPLQLVTPDTVLRSQDANLLVRHDQQGSRITVLRGLVEVSSRHTPSPLTVAAGWQILVDSQGADAPRQTDGFLAQAWVRGILPAERMRLDVLLAELSRYRPGILRCSEQVAALRVTGSFQLDDTDAALKLLAHALPVRIERRTRYWVTLLPV